MQHTYKGWEFFTSVLADGLSLESEWQQISSSLQDSPQYSGQSRQCCSLDSLHPSRYFQVLQSFYQSFGDCTKSTNYNWYHHHHHVVPLARISLTLSRHFSLSFITSGRSSGLHPVSSHSCWMYVRAGRPAFARPYVGVHRSTSLMSSSLLLQQCPACLVHLTWIFFVMGSKWPITYSTDFSIP